MDDDKALIFKLRLYITKPTASRPSRVNQQDQETIPINNPTDNINWHHQPTTPMESVKENIKGRRTTPKGNIKGQRAIQGMLS